MEHPVFSVASGPGMSQGPKKARKCAVFDQTPSTPVQRETRISGAKKRAAKKTHEAIYYQYLVAIHQSTSQWS